MRPMSHVVSGIRYVKRKEIAVNRVEMEERTLDFGVRIIKMASQMPRDRVGDVLGRQVLRSGTSIRVNYHEAGAASSKRHFVTTMETAERESAETCYWLKLISRADVMPSDRLEGLLDESTQLRRIIRKPIKTAKTST